MSESFCFETIPAQMPSWIALNPLAKALGVAADSLGDLTAGVVRSGADGIESLRVQPSRVAGQVVVSIPPSVTVSYDSTYARWGGRRNTSSWTQNV